MFLGRIGNIGKEKKDVNLLIASGLDYICATDFIYMNGRYEIADNMYVNVQEYVTADKGECKPEAHIMHIDIQYIIEGAEIIGVSELAPQSAVLADCSYEQDYILYKDAVNETELLLTTGMCAIFFPWDVHRPCCKVAEREKVKKAVVKLKIY